MEHSKVETAVITETVLKVADEQIRELSELQLALVGGGGVDVALQ